jgi:integrase
MKKPTMIALAEEYLAYRRDMGVQMRVEGRALLRFARWADRSGHVGPVTTDLALQWAWLPGECTRASRAYNLDIVRRFAKHRAIFDAQTEIPPAGLLGPAYRRTAPHIYSKNQIVQILAMAKTLSPSQGLRPRTYYTLFGLLACTGLRVSEAIALSKHNVDLQRGVLIILQSKCHQSRLVPLHPSAIPVLRQYASFRDRYHTATLSQAFFLSERGMPLTTGGVRAAFRKIRQKSGWRVSPTGRLPRVHDLRHTFACRRLLGWYKTGVNVDQAILSLSTYLGHKEVTDTYWYLTGTPELMSLAAGRLAEFANAGGAR